jgi:hypothetical protein
MRRGAHLRFSGLMADTLSFPVGTRKSHQFSLSISLPLPTHGPKSSNTLSHKWSSRLNPTKPGLFLLPSHLFQKRPLSRLLAVLLISASFCTTPPEPLHRILAIFYIQVTTHVFMLSINVTLRSCGPPSEYLILKRLNLLGKVGRLSREMTSRSQSRQRSS